MHAQIDKYLELIDKLPLECDGMTRILSQILHRDGVPHQCFFGSLDVDGVHIASPVHYWIELEDDRVIDLRARMWFRPEVEAPHGLFRPLPSQRYQKKAFVDFRGATGEDSPITFEILTGSKLTNFAVGFGSSLLAASTPAELSVDHSATSIPRPRRP